MISPETRMMGLPYGEEIMIVGRTVWTQSTSVTDRRTDRRTDRITITDTVQTASHGRNPRIVYLVMINHCYRKLDMDARFRTLLLGQFSCALHGILNVLQQNCISSVLLGGGSLEDERSVYNHRHEY